MPNLSRDKPGQLFSSTLGAKFGRDRGLIEIAGIRCLSDGDGDAAGIGRIDASSYPVEGV
jgi:hypothetical protein